MNKQKLPRKKPLWPRLRLDLKKNRFAYLCMMPVLLWYVLFCYFPIYGVLMAFQDFKPAKGIAGSKFVGLKHFQSFVSSMFFSRTVTNTLMLSLWSLAIGFTAPILLALLLNEVNNLKFKKAVQTITYMPHFISLVVLCGILRMFCQYGGVLTVLVNAVTGKEYVSLLQEASLFRPIYTFSGVWQEIGWDSIIYLSAMTSIDSTLYEAAEMDGAGRFRKMWHVTLPQIMPTIIILLILRVGSLMSTSYEKVILLYNPTIYSTADTLGSYIYRRGIEEASYSLSSAVGLFCSVINFFMLWITNKISRKFADISIM